jgi:predicted metal-dependent hydrolase
MLFKSINAAPAPGDVVEVAGRPVRFKVHASARRVSIRIDPTKRECVATAPSARRLGEALAFARSRADWIASRLDALPAAGGGFQPGMTIQVLDRPVRLERARMRIAPKLLPATEDEPARLLAYGEGETFQRAVLRCLKAEALRLLAERTAAYAAELGAKPPSVAVMDAKARWGSCTPPQRGAAGRIRYSWRLVLAPFTVLDYVAAHECAHLIEANHGPRFWALVKTLYGDHRQARAWLKAHGVRLHAVGAG